MPPMKRVTLREVANLAGVSPGVVSYVINNGPRAASPEARRRVLEAIEALSYHPNASARGLRQQRTRTIGFISYDYFPLDAFFAPYNAGLLTGLTGALLPHRHYVLQFPLGIGGDLGELNELLQSGRLDGVVVRLSEEPPVTDALLEVITRAGVPCVCLEHAGAARFGFSSVTYNDEESGYLATRYLIEQGHRRIGHIRGDVHHLAARDRLAGYRRALREGGLPADEELIQGGSWLPAEAVRGMHRLLELDPPPTAVFAASDQLAISIVQVLREQGHKVPGEMAVVGFDDVPLYRDLLPPLTTMRIPLVELGRRAAELILQATHGADGDTVAEVVPLELVRRGTA
ncbi:MAG TPA: LacI family DNA-binding transcriptional regulator [Chloroflexota bacterium]|nr:LacI family DNA-binding transcriptional regulator [Chloroflexota bacterium]